MIAIGIDSHKSSFAASAVDGVGSEIDRMSGPNTEAGHATLLRWLAGLDAERRVGIEGAGGLGRPLAQYLLGAGEAVVEVPPSLTARERRRRPRPTKSDPEDALAIARVTLREPDLPRLGRTDTIDDLALVVRARDELVAARTQLANRLHADLATLAPGYEAGIPNLVAARHLAAAGRLLRRSAGVRAELAGDRLAELRRLDRRISQLTGRLPALLVAAGSTLTTLPGVGTVMAAKLLAETGDVRRFRSEAAFAAIAGTAPLEASSGRVRRHRLNRGGNRQLNRALHQIALVQSTRHPAARAYLERRRAAGSSWLEAMRCLKRYLARTTFRIMLADALRAAA